MRQHASRPLTKSFLGVSTQCLPGPLPEEVAQCISLAEALALLCPLEGVPHIAARISLMAKRVQRLETQGLSMAPEEQALWLAVYTEASDPDRALGDLLVWFEHHDDRDGSTLLKRAYPHLKPAPQKEVQAAVAPLPSHVPNPSEAASAFSESAATPSALYHPSRSISASPAMTCPPNPHQGSRTSPVHALPYVQPSAPSFASASSTPPAADPTSPLPPSDLHDQSHVFPDSALPASPLQQRNTLSQAGSSQALNAVQVVSPNIPLPSTGHAGATDTSHAPHSRVSADDQQDAPSAVTQHVTMFLVEAKVRTLQFQRAMLSLLTRAAS